MKRLILPVLLILSVPAQATVTRYQWEGTVDHGADLSTAIRGDFTYDDAAPTFADGDGRMLHDGSIKSVNLFIGSDFYASNSPWYSTVEPIPSFTDINLLDGPNPGYNNFSWDKDGWWIAFNDGENTWREIGGKVVSFYSDGWVPDLPGRDAAPVPEPAGFVLMASGLAAYALFRRRARSLPRSRT